jgi:hypothetical protein
MSQTRELTTDHLPILNERESRLVSGAATQIEFGDAGMLGWGRELIKSNRRIGRLIVEDQLLAMQEAPPDYSYRDAYAHYDGLRNGYQAICSYMSMVGFLRSGLDLPHKYLRQLRRGSTEMPVNNESQAQRVSQVRRGDAPLEEWVMGDRDIIDSSELAGCRARTYLATTPPLNRVLDAAAKRFGFLHDRHVDSFADGYGLGYENAIEMYVQSREEALMPEF